MRRAGLHRWLVGSAAPVALATGARVAFGVCLAAVVVGILLPVESVRFFQLLFVQSIFITFVSGPGYAHVLSAALDGRGGETMQRFVRFVALAVIASLAILWIVPADRVRLALGAEPGLISWLVVGGGAAALHGVLQGVVQAVRSTWHAFAPSIGISLIASAGLFLPVARGVDGLVAVLALYQIGCLAALCAVNAPALLRLGAARSSPLARHMRLFSETSAFGLINCLSILITYLLRENWIGHAPAELAEAVFFLWRMSDLYLGVFATLIAGSAAMRRLRDGPLAIGGVSALPLAAGLLLLVALAMVWLASSVWPLILAVLLAQLLAEAIRLPSVAATIAEVQRGRAARYALVVLPGPALAALAILAFVPAGSLIAIYGYLVLASGLQLLSHLAQRSRVQPRRPR